MSDWIVFRSRGLHLIHLHINILLSKIEELRYIAKSTNATIIDICESKLDASVLEQEISLDNYKILRCDRNRHRGGVACYVRNYLSYNILSVFPSEIESIFCEILLPNSKPITLGTIYCVPNLSHFSKILTNNMSNIDSVNNNVYILRDFNIKSHLNGSYFWDKKIIISSKSIPSDVKSCHGYRTLFG